MSLFELLTGVKRSVVEEYGTHLDCQHEEGDCNEAIAQVHAGAEAQEDWDVVDDNSSKQVLSILAEKYLDD